MQVKKVVGNAEVARKILDRALKHRDARQDFHSRNQNLEHHHSGDSGSVCRSRKGRTTTRSS